MKFTANKETLKRNLSRIGGIIGNTNTMPIINCIYMELDVDRQMLIAKTTDLSTSFSVYMGVYDIEVGERKSVAAPSSLLLKILKEIDSENVEFCVDDNTLSITLKTENGSYSLSGRDSENFPQTAAPKPENAITLPVGTVMKCIEKVSFAISRDDIAHQTLSGMLIDVKTDGVIFVGTDGHKMARYKRTDVSSDEEYQAVIPSKPLSVVKGVMASTDKNADVQIYRSENNMVFRFDNILSVIRVIDGKYPAYEKAFPDGEHNSMRISSDDLAKAIRRVSLFANETTSQIGMNIDKESVTICAEDIDFANNAKESVPCSYNGEPLVIGFNANFVRSAVSAIGSENVIFHMTTPTRPAIIIPETEDDDNAETKMLIMPMAMQR